MKVNVYYTRDNGLHNAYLAAMYNGIFGYGDDASYVPLESYKPNECDIAVVFGIGKKSVPASNARAHVISIESSLGHDVVILERGYIHREHFYSCGLNGINGNALFNNYNMPSDRFDSLKVELHRWRRPDTGKHILLIGQVPWDASVQHTDHIAWLNSAAMAIREYSDKPIIYRPHPLAGKARAYHVPGTEISKRSLLEDMMDASCMVTFNSNSGVDAVIAGVPAICQDRGSMIFHNAQSGLENIESPPMWHRDQWAADLAYAQWTQDEMIGGAAWAHIRPLIYDRMKDAEVEND